MKITACLLVFLTAACAFAETPGPRPVSRKRAFLMSLVLPGSGELYCGARKTGAAFMGAEAALWLTAFGFSSYRGWAQEDARGYAALHAGVNADAVGDDREFYKNVGDWMSMDAYNRYTELSGGAPIYSERSGFGWAWASDGALDEYLDLRSRMILAERRRNVTFSAIAVNHLLSALNAARASRAAVPRTVFRADYHTGQDCLVVTAFRAF